MSTKKKPKNEPDQPAPSKRVTIIGRNASTGQFVNVKTAKSRPATHVVETIKKLIVKSSTSKKIDIKKGKKIR